MDRGLLGDGDLGLLGDVRRIVRGLDKGLSGDGGLGSELSGDVFRIVRGLYIVYPL